MNLSKHKTKQILLTFSKPPLSKDSRNLSLPQIFTLFQVHVPFKKDGRAGKMTASSPAAVYTGRLGSG